MHVRFGSLADIATGPRDVRFTPESGIYRRPGNYLRSRVIGKRQPIKAHLRTKKSRACNAHGGLPKQLEGSRRETSTCRPCCRILFFNRFH
jgi:hypothetical protein